MKNKGLILLSILFLLALTASGILLSQNYKLKKQVFRLSEQVSSLENEVEDADDRIASLEAENQEMEEQLDDVKHFDNGISRGGYSGGTSGVSYTGSALQTKIDGAFEGWSGETIFKMMDGSIWQQASYSYIYHYSYMPNVLIYSKSGSYYMRVEGLDDEIRVTRIK